MTTSNASPIAPATIRIAAGRSYHMWVDRDTMLIVQSGSINVRETPYWIGDIMLSSRTALHAGQHYRFGQGGWACLHAIRHAEIHCLAVSPGHRFSVASIANWLALPERLRRLFVHP